MKWLKNATVMVHAAKKEKNDYVKTKSDSLVRKRADRRWEGAIVIGHKKDGKT